MNSYAAFEGYRHYKECNTSKIILCWKISENDRELMKYSDCSLGPREERRDKGRS